MNTVARFEKVSYEQFYKDMRKCCVEHLSDEEIAQAYNEIKIPTRATVGSAGYDFYMPESIEKFIGNNVDGEVVPTGIRCFIDDGWVLMLFPRSGNGFKYGVKLRNTVGIVDSDYYNADNEGHIMAKLTWDCDAFASKANKGDRFIQGLFVPFGVAENAEAFEGTRTGGFGSTGK